MYLWISVENHYRMIYGLDNRTSDFASMVIVFFAGQRMREAHILNTPKKKRNKTMHGREMGKNIMRQNLFLSWKQPLI